MSPALVPTHRQRLLAFLIDVALLTIVTAPFALRFDSLLPSVAVIVLSWIGYHTLTVWWFAGRTVGKAMMRLSVRHGDGSPPAPTRRDFLWALARASAGYLVVDMFGLGLLVTFINPRHRCLHDYVVNSDVVHHPGLPAGVLAGLDTLQSDGEAAMSSRGQKYKSLHWAWTEATVIPASLASLFTAISDAWHAMASKLAGTGKAAATTHAAGSLGTAKLVAVVAATSIVTAGAAGAATRTYLDAPVVGTWGGFSISRTGLESYRGINLAQFTFSADKSGCTVPVRAAVARLTGRGTHYTGVERWWFGENGTNCITAWAVATFDLTGPDILHICSTDPWTHSHSCDDYARQSG